MFLNSLFSELNFTVSTDSSSEFTKMQLLDDQGDSKAIFIFCPKLLLFRKISHCCIHLKPDFGIDR